MTTKITSADESQKIKVVATFSILGDWVQNVAGVDADVQILVGANSDVHTFEPTPREMKILQQADIILENGAKLESWLDDLYQSSQSKAERIEVIQGLNLIAVDHRDEDVHKKESHHHSDQDPHVWHDVALVIKIIERIDSELSDKDPIHASTYHANAQQYIQELKDLDVWITDQVKKIPPARRKLVTSHDSFGYFARRYGFIIIGAAVNSFTTEAFDPSAARIAQLISKVRSENVSAVFTENMFNNQLIKALADEAQVTLAPPLYSGALGETQSEGSTYIEMMKYNIKQITEVLK
ncbi:MAG: zinc ABC transporter substrate-binding protein [Candidatus Omnitrophica bacterium]|nr:zinc ABC transporter substrate-binding protein [Candidatus Omnitrophota bacterium]MCB9747499.1 zinc ABC transporter substrate-binding protein [Candidatus Omnitrophota bacterium]